MRARSTLLVMITVVAMLLWPLSPLYALDVKIGNLDANLSSAVSNNTSVSWYNFASPYASISSGQQTPPKILTFCNDSTMNVVVDYRCRDDSSVKGKDQECKLDVWKWNPTTYTWEWTGSSSKSKGSAGWGKYNMTGTISWNSWWSSSSNVALIKAQGYAKSGDKSTTKTREFWVVRGVTKTGTGYADAPRWMCDRYSRSMFFKQVANNLQSMENSSGSSAISDGLNVVIDYGKAFAQPSAADFGTSSGLDALSILNAAWKTVPATGEILDATGVMANGLSWVQTAIALLTTGIRDAIANAQQPTMTQQAAASVSGVRASLNTLADASRDDAKSCEDLTYGSGSTTTWRSKLDSEKAAIDAALTSVTNARSSLSTWRAGYDSYASVPYIGQSTINNANAVQSNFNTYLNYIEDQLKSDKAIIDKAASL